jgi:hypothetical protein
MQRRSLIKSILKAKSTSKQVLSTPVPTLDRYEGEWTINQVFHLLRRATYKLDLSNLDQLVNMGLGGIVDLLTGDIPLPDPPINYDFENDPNCAIGETWVNAPYYRSNGYQLRSIRYWSTGRFISKEMHIREKLTLFWHNHFPISDVNDSRFMYDYSSLLREHGLGNFKELTKKMTIHPAMLRYLNGNQNTRNSPNENYARELLELFTIGKGDLAGPGDYTNYTEDDVREIAKVLTGWRDRGYRSGDSPEYFAQFRANVHDNTTKTLSHRFGNAVIEDQGDQEYSNLIDVIFNQDEVSRYLARKLYRWFVYYEINEEIEQNIIEPLAQIIRDNNYEVKPALIALLSSQHFYDIEHRGCIIKNPIDYVCGALNTFGIVEPEEFSAKYNFWRNLNSSLNLLQMIFFNPPSVAGWSAYYQEPLFYRSWLNSVTLPLRKVFTDVLLNRGVGNFVDEPDLVKLIDQASNPYDVNALLEELSALMFPKPLSENQLSVLKEILIPGLPDFEWSVEYGDYTADPENEDLKQSLQMKLQSLFTYMTHMPEFQLS